MTTAAHGRKLKNGCSTYLGTIHHIKTKQNPSNPKETPDAPPHSKDGIQGKPAGAVLVPNLTGTSR